MVHRSVFTSFATHLCRDDTVDHGAGHHSRADEAELGVGDGHGADLETKGNKRDSAR